MPGLILHGALIGLGATILMDLWAVLVARLLGQKPPDWGLPGRWFWHLRRGEVFHDDIAAAEPYAHERALGWGGHYAIGILYGIVFALIAGPGWLAAPTLRAAWIFAILTIAAGWFLFQPGMGLGWAASRTPDPARRRALGLLSHSVFGIGLWATALLIR